MSFFGTTILEPNAQCWLELVRVWFFCHPLASSHILLGSLYMLVMIALAHVRDRIVSLTFSQMIELCSVIRRPDSEW
jgi:hypothetical protein